MSKPKQNVVGDGIISVVDGSILTLTIDLNKNFGTSGSGKTIRIASSKGGVQVPDAPDVTMNVNVYKYPPRQ